MRTAAVRPSLRVGALPRGWPTLSLLPAMMVVTVVTLFPVPVLDRALLHAVHPVRSWYGTRFVGLRNYVEILPTRGGERPGGHPSVRRRGRVAVQFVLGVPVAVLSNQEIPGTRIRSPHHPHPHDPDPVVVGPTGSSC